MDYKKLNFIPPKNKKIFKGVTKYPASNNVKFKMSNIQIETYKEENIKLISRRKINKYNDTKMTVDGCSNQRNFLSCLIYLYSRYINISLFKKIKASIRVKMRNTKDIKETN